MQPKIPHGQKRINAHPFSGQPKSDDSETSCMTSADSEVKINEKETLLRSKSTDGTQTPLQKQSSSKLRKRKSVNGNRHKSISVRVCLELA